MSLTRFPNGIEVPQIVTPSSYVNTTGKVFYVNNGTIKAPGAKTGSDGAGHDGSYLKPFASLDYAIGQAVAGRGDIIRVMPGHSETHAAANSGATAAITVDKEGLTIEGLGNGDDNPKFLANFAVSTIDLIEVTADSCRIRGLTFPASTTAAPESRIDVQDTDCAIEGCVFYCGAFDAESITIPATGDNLTIQGNKFIVTANGPDAAIEIEASVERVNILNNYFDGMSVTNAWDAAAINSTVGHTNIWIQGNSFAYGTGIISSGTGTGLVAANIGGTPYTLNAENYVDIAGGGEIKVVTPDGPTSDAQSESTTGNVFYVDSVNGTAGNPATSPRSPEVSLDTAIGLCTANNGDTIILMPNHAEDVTTQIDVDVAGVKIIGIGNGFGFDMPELKNSFAAGTSATLRIDADGVEIAGIKFRAGDTANTIGNIEIVAGANGGSIHDCYIQQDANDAQGITFLGACTDWEIRKNTFVVTGNGPDEAIHSRVGALTRVNIVENTFDGMNVTNTWDDNIISSDQTNIQLYFDKNIFKVGDATNRSAYGLDDVTSTTFGPNNQYLFGCRRNTGTPLTFIVGPNGTATDIGDSIDNPMDLVTAVNLCKADVGDTVLLLPGTYTLAATLTLDVASMRIGPYYDNGTFNVTITTDQDVDLVTLTGSSVEVWGLKFIGNAAQTTTPTIIDLDTGDHCRIHDCYFDANSVASLVSIDIAATSTDTKIDHNYFVGQVATVGSIVDLGARTIVTENNCNQLAADGYFINNDGLATGGAMYYRNRILGDGGAGAAMCLFDSTSPVQFLCAENMFCGTTSATPFGQDAEWTTMFVNNYVANNAGGVLVDPVA